MNLKLHHFLISLLIIILSSCNKELVEPDLSFEIKNATTGYEYLVDVVYFDGQPSDKILFILDPSSMLPMVQKSLKDIKYQEGITLVAIDFKGENKRNRDYTPTQDGEETGEANEFFNFIVNQLDTELKTRGVLNSSSEIGIIGHSISGLATAYAFVAHNDYFQNFVIGSPSLWWDSYSIFGIEKNYRNANYNANSRIFIGIGIQEDLGMQNAFVAFREVIRENYQNVSIKTHLSIGGHMGSRSETINEGLKFIMQ